MDWIDVARGTFKVINKFSGADEYSPKNKYSEFNREPPKTSTVFLRERKIFDDFVSSNAKRNLGDCKEELLVLINSFVEKAYSLGGEDMREGLIDEVKKAGY